jgi:hypothetical protein
MRVKIFVLILALGYALGAFVMQWYPALAGAGCMFIVFLLLGGFKHSPRVEGNTYEEDL